MRKNSPPKLVRRNSIPRIMIPEIRVGTILSSARPNFIAASKGNCPATPGFYITDSASNKNYIGYLRGLNKADMPKDYEEYLELGNARNYRELSIAEDERLKLITSRFPFYKLILREILSSSNDRGNITAYLEEMVETNDGVFVKIDNLMDDVHGRFLNYYQDKWSYTFSVTQEEGDMRVNPGDFVLGIVLDINPEHSHFDLVPVDLVNAKRYQIEKNRIIRPSKK
ncbi:hypothetical protein HYW74_04365 [Candidatus Pacearchaeota archaeon]|nr:hypothetical protein [Candidatus Pacearchaeota archaeon]